MSFVVSSAVWRYSRARGVAKYVLLALADRASRDGRVWAGVDRLADDTGLTARTVQRALRQLVASGELVEVAPGGGRHRTATYYIPAALQAADQPRETVTESHPFMHVNGDTESRNGDRARRNGDTESRNGDSVSPEPVKNQSDRTGLRTSQDQADIQPTTKRTLHDGLCPVTPEDVELWQRALDALAESGLARGNVEQVAELEPIGRDASGRLHLRARLHRSVLQPFEPWISRALADAGDAAGRVVIVEQR